MNNLIGIIVMSVYIGIILVSSKFVAKFGEEAGRKYVHIMLANVWFFIMYFFDSLIWASILPAAFVVINALSYKFNIMKSIERENNDGFGTVYYAMSLLILCIATFLIHKPAIGLLGTLIMGYGDGFAAIIGKKVKSPKYQIGNSKKSVAGSLTMFSISLIFSLIILNLLGANYFILKSFGIAVAATILEAISIKGLDNITVPIIVTLLTFFSL